MRTPATSPIPMSELRSTVSGGSATPVANRAVEEGEPLADRGTKALFRPLRRDPVRGELCPLPADAFGGGGRRGLERGAAAARSSSSRLPQLPSAAARVPCRAGPARRAAAAHDPRPGAPAGWLVVAPGRRDR